MAAVLALRRSARLSHRSAAELWGCSTAEPAPIDVTVPARAARSKRHGHPHPSLFLTATRDTTIRNGIAVTTPARTLADLQRRSPRRRVRRPCARRSSRPTDSVRSRPTAPAASSSSASCASAGVIACRRPRCNVRVGRFAVDFLWREPRLVVETDGYRSTAGDRRFEDDRAASSSSSALGSARAPLQRRAMVAVTRSRRSRSTAARTARTRRSPRQYDRCDGQDEGRRSGEELFLIDGNSLAYRAFFALPGVDRDRRRPADERDLRLRLDDGQAPHRPFAAGGHRRLGRGAGRAARRSTRSTRRSASRARTCCASSGRTWRRSPRRSASRNVAGRGLRGRRRDRDARPPGRRGRDPGDGRLRRPRRLPAGRRRGPGDDDLARGHRHEDLRPRRRDRALRRPAGAGPRPDRAQGRHLRQHPRRPRDRRQDRRRSCCSSSARSRRCSTRSTRSPARSASRT